MLYFLVRSFAYIEQGQGRALNILPCRAPGLAGIGEVHIYIFIIFFGEIHILLSQNQSSKTVASRLFAFGSAAGIVSAGNVR